MRALEAGLSSVPGCAAIVGHPEYAKLRLYKNHFGSVYRHSLIVADISYRLGIACGMRAESIARGALLHDLFFYDWRIEPRPGGRSHGFSHPAIARENAERLFGPLSNLERDIIEHHMWPLTPCPPQSREALLVSLVDKLVATYEYGIALSRRVSPRPSVAKGARD